MAVKLEKQNSPLGSALVWLLLLGGAAAGFWYYRIRSQTPPPQVAKAPEKTLEKIPEYENLPPPKIKEEPVEVTPEPAKEEPKEPEKPEKPAEPEVVYHLAKSLKEVKPRLGKGPDALDRQMWEIDAAPEKPYRWDAETGKKILPAITRYMSKEASKVVPHPSAAQFPGPVGDAPRVAKVIKIPLRTSRWASTGLYAPPGEIIRIQVSSELRGAVVVIGCHTDNIASSTREKTHRFPLISSTHPLDKTSIEAANPFGGLIYIDVPEKKEWEKTKSEARVEIQGAVESPLFVLGQTTPEEWKRIRKAPAPWGEIGGKSFIGAARSARFRDMDFETAKALAEYWDSCVEQQDWLCGWPSRRTPERMVPDAEITHGYGHSGYPYVGYLGWENWTDLKHITTEGGFGHYHEIGHNHQSTAWTFDGYTEVTNNVLALYNRIKLAKLEPESHFEGNMDSILAVRIGPPPKEFANGNLAMYVPVINAFGWDALRATFTEYIKRGARSGMNLANDSKKKETFVLTWSKHCKANLGPYFEHFGFPYTPSMRTRLSSLKRWMPVGFPPKIEGAEARLDPEMFKKVDHGAKPQDHVMEE